MLERYWRWTPELVSWICAPGTVSAEPVSSRTFHGLSLIFIFDGCWPNLRFPFILIAFVARFVFICLRTLQLQPYPPYARPSASINAGLAFWSRRKHH